MTTLQGIDTSRYQGVVDWHQVAASGVTFAATRYGVGTTYEDPYAASNLLGMREAGIIPGAYHIVTAGVDQLASARFFVAGIQRILGGTTGVLMCVDVETVSGAGNATPEEAIAFTREVQHLIGRPPLAYIPQWWMDSNGWPTGQLSDCPYWHSAYNRSTPPDTMPTVGHGWTSAPIWQWTETGSCPGVAGAVDRDTYFGDLPGLRALAGYPTTPTPAPQEDDMIRLFKADGITYAGAPSVWYQVPTAEYATVLADALGLTVRTVNTRARDVLASAFLSMAPAAAPTTPVDVTALAAKLAPLLSSSLTVDVSTDVIEQALAHVHATTTLATD